MLGDHVGRLEVLADGVVIWSQVGGKHEGTHKELVIEQNENDSDVICGFTHRASNTPRVLYTCKCEHARRN